MRGGRSDPPDLIIGINGLPHGVVGLQQGRVGDGGLVPEVLVSVEFPPEHVATQEPQHLGCYEPFTSSLQSAAHRTGAPTGISHHGRQERFLFNLFPDLKHFGQFIKKMHNFRDLQNPLEGGDGWVYSNMVMID